MTLSAESPIDTSKKTKIDIPKKLDRFNKARLISIIDLGHQPGFEHQGKEIPDVYKIEFGYELVDSLMEDGRPHCIWEKVKRSDYEPKDGKSGFTSTMMARVRALDPDNESCDGKNLKALLGKPCKVKPTLNKNGWVVISGAQSGVIEADEDDDIKEPQNPLIYFEMDDPDMDLWNSFTDFKKDLIMGAINYPHTKLSELVNKEAEDNILF